MNKINTEIRGAGLISPMALVEYRALSPGQPLVLVRERDNPVDANAIIASTALLQPCGYIAKEAAKFVAPELDAGIVWLAKVTATGRAFRYPQVVLWKESTRRQMRAALEIVDEEMRRRQRVF
jgi:hypothetical protein